MAHNHSPIIFSQRPTPTIFHSWHPFISSRCIVRIAATSEDGNAPPPAGPRFGLRQIVGDGRCMFRALAQGAHYCTLLDADPSQPLRFLTASQETTEADNLRNAICDVLLDRRNQFEAFIDSDESSNFEDYVNKMRLSPTFGGEPELVAAADVIGRPITVFAVNPEKKELRLINEYVCSEAVSQPGDWPVPLVYHAAGPQSGHYDLLAPMESTDEEP